jgi:broad specificity phosphatase PhoE
MPVYTSAEGTMKVIGSRDELFKLNKPFAQLTKFILIRHGRTDYNDKKLVDYHNKARLTDLGKQQAQDLINKLADHKVDVIYSSPFDRCMETIRPYAEAM